MKKLVLTSAAVVALSMGVMAGFAVGGFAGGSTTTTTNNAHNKVTICHATGSKKNPYVVITPDASGVIDGHYPHQDKRDIIPPFDYVGKDKAVHHFPGQNWTAEGQAIFANGCKKPGAGSTGTTGTTSTSGTATQTVTVAVPTPGPTKTVTVVKSKRVTVVKKIHAHIEAHLAPKNTG